MQPHLRKRGWLDMDSHASGAKKKEAWALEAVNQSSEEEVEEDDVVAIPQEPASPPPKCFNFLEFHKGTCVVPLRTQKDFLTSAV